MAIKVLRPENEKRWIFWVNVNGEEFGWMHNINNGLLYFATSFINMKFTIPNKLWQKDELGAYSVF